MTSVRLRLVSTSVAAALIVATAYMALTQKFALISDIFVDPAPIETVVEQKEPPPVVEEKRVILPPPVVEQRPTVADTTAPPVPYVEPYVEPTPSGPAVITDPQWIERPTGRDFARYYPERAIARDRSGRVVLDCIVAADGRIGCSVASEDPPGWGFGDAALRIARSFRMSPRLENGAATEGGRVRVPINFRLE